MKNYLEEVSENLGLAFVKHSRKTAHQAGLQLN